MEAFSKSADVGNGRNVMHRNWLLLHKGAVWFGYLKNFINC